VNTDHLRDYRALRRSVTDRKIAGVAGGLGRHLGIDPTILRVAFVVLVFFGGAGLVLYGAGWLLVPEEGSDDAVIDTSPSTRNGLLIVAGVLAALLLLGDTWNGFWFPWPLAVIALVVFAIWKNKDRSMHTPSPTAAAAGAPAGSSAGIPTEPAPGSAAGPQAAQQEAQYADPYAGTYAAPGTESGQTPPPWAPPPAAGYGPPAPPPRPMRRDRGPLLFVPTLALVALGLGVLGLLDVAGVSVISAAYPALALAIVGAMLVLGAWVGRAGGLILLGVVSAIALAITSVAAGPVFDEGTRLDVAPTTAAGVRDAYSVPAGSVRVDLSQVTDPEALDGRSIDITANAGELRVIVPDDVTVHVDADVQVGGEADVAGRYEAGPDVHVNRTIDAGPSAPEIDLDLSLLVGSIEVRQS
jgi:phage shock protein PspC (stress-responsive transcriptional regulator)